MSKELVGGDGVGQAGEELGHVDEVHARQHVLVQPQDAQRRAEQELVPVAAEHVPHPARQVQGERLAVQGENPGGGPGSHTHRVKGHCFKPPGNEADESES